MGVSDLFEKLINEHGSAAILKERVVALKDLIIELEKENSSLKSENEVLKNKTIDLELKNNDIKKEKNICQARLDKIHSITLNEKHEKVLIAVASYSGQYSVVLAQITGLSEQETKSKLNYLSSLGLLHFKAGSLKDQDNPKLFPKAVNIWFVSGPGHSYIKAHNLNEKIA
jgi:FtsZ-binding cell division protein ZapB